MFEVPSRPEIGQVVVTAEAVRGEEALTLVTREQLAQRANCPPDAIHTDRFVNP